MTLPSTHREVHLVRHPDGPLHHDDLRVVEAPLPSVRPGEALVRNILFPVAAVTRTLMDPGPGIGMPGFVPGGALWGQAIGAVVDAGDTALAAGDLVSHSFGWREYAAVPAAAAQKVDPDALPDLAAHLSPALVGWLAVELAEVRPGDSVVVLGASGGLGSIVGQLARRRGASNVVGSTGSATKAERLTDESGYDSAVLRTGDIDAQLRSAAPDGIDVIIDLVGGAQLAAALAQANQAARVSLVGALSVQVGGGFAAPVEIDTTSITARGITLRGVSFAAHMDTLSRGMADLSEGLRDGSVRLAKTTVHGIDQAPQALIDVLDGTSFGLTLVEV